jgi:hypothetical protein
MFQLWDSSRDTTYSEKVVPRWHRCLCYITQHEHTIVGVQKKTLWSTSVIIFLNIASWSSHVNYIQHMLVELGELIFIQNFMQWLTLKPKHELECGYLQFNIGAIVEVVYDHITCPLGWIIVVYYSQFCINEYGGWLSTYSPINIHHKAHGP